MGGGSEYEPRDSRNVTGTASSRDKRWTNTSGQPPRADGTPAKPAPGDSEEEAEPSAPERTEREEPSIPPPPD